MMLINQANGYKNTAHENSILVFKICNDLGGNQLIDLGGGGEGSRGVLPLELLLGWEKNNGSVILFCCPVSFCKAIILSQMYF